MGGDPAADIAGLTFVKDRIIEDLSGRQRSSKPRGRLQAATSGGSLGDAETVAADFAKGAVVSVTTRLTGSAPINGLGSSGTAEIGRQARYVGADVHGSLRITSALDLTAGVDNLFDVRPDGRQAAIARRFRLGLQARDLF